MLAAYVVCWKVSKMQYIRAAAAAAAAGAAAAGMARLATRFNLAQVAVQDYTGDHPHQAVVSCQQG
jgi:hypothetical protein